MDLDNPGNYVYSTMWLWWQGTQYWIELGTAYAYNATNNFGLVCVPGFCDFWFYTGAYTSVGSHTWKIDRNSSNHNRWEWFIDGNLYSFVTASFTSGSTVTVGLESYNMSLYIEPHAFYSLKYKRWEGVFQAWAGQDSQVVDVIMCGEWHLPTSWWAGEFASCS
ncbi:MAG: hypothetical protein ABI797_02100 [Chloroflexota bacterium]